MKFQIILMALLSVSIASCTQEAPTVKHRKSMSSSSENLQNIKVVNAEDPICHMKTSDYLKDTLTYQNKTYGFCSVYCKDEFKKNPSKYAQD